MTTEGPQTMAELLAGAEKDEGEPRPLRSAGVLSLREASVSPEGPLALGATVFALVRRPEPAGHAVLSPRRARRARRWIELAEEQKAGEAITAAVVGANRGAVVVDVGVRGFGPRSQLSSRGALDRLREGQGDGVP